MFEKYICLDKLSSSKHNSKNQNSILRYAGECLAARGCAARSDALRTRGWRRKRLCQRSVQIYFPKNVFDKLLWQAFYFETYSNSTCNNTVTKIKMAKRKRERKKGTPTGRAVLLADACALTSSFQQTISATMTCGDIFKNCCHCGN